MALKFAYVHYFEMNTLKWKIPWPQRLQMYIFCLAIEISGMFRSKVIISANSLHKIFFQKE